MTEQHKKIILNDRSTVEFLKSTSPKEEWFWLFTDNETGERLEGERYSSFDDCYLDARDHFGNR